MKCTLNLIGMVVPLIALLLPFPGTEGSAKAQSETVNYTPTRIVLSRETKDVVSLELQIEQQWRSGGGPYELLVVLEKNGSPIDSGVVFFPGMIGGESCTISCINTGDCGGWPCVGSVPSQCYCDFFKISYPFDDFVAFDGDELTVIVDADNMVAEWDEFDNTMSRTLDCCNHDGISGDVNYDNQGPNIADLTFLVQYVFGGGPAPPCTSEADMNGNGNIDSIVEITYLVAYLFGGGPPPALCP